MEHSLSSDDYMAGSYGIASNGCPHLLTNTVYVIPVSAVLPLT